MDWFWAYCASSIRFLKPRFGSVCYMRNCDCYTVLCGKKHLHFTATTRIHECLFWFESKLDTVVEFFACFSIVRMMMMTKRIWEKSILKCCFLFYRFSVTVCMESWENFSVSKLTSLLAPRTSIITNCAAEYVVVKIVADINTFLLLRDTNI